MKEYTLNINKKTGCIHIAKDFWNPDKSIEAMDNKPFLFEVGMKVVDIFSNVVTIKEIIKHPPTKPGQCPQWNLLVEESRNCYIYYEIAGIYVKTISDKNLISFLISEEDQTSFKEETEWIKVDTEKPVKDALVEVLLKDGHIMSGYFDGNTWFVNDGFVVGVAEGHVPMYSSSCGSDDVRYWRKYQLPEGFDFDIDDYTL